MGCSLSLLREEDSTIKRLEKLVDDYLWATKSVYKEIMPERELQDVKKLLKNSTFQFSPILRFWTGRETFLELVRGKGQSKELLVVGLLVSIKINGKLEIRAPFRRWKIKLTLSYLTKNLGGNLTLPSMLKVLFNLN